MSRRFHTDTRTSENFTEQGLASLTRESKPQWGRYVIKELIDNALEANESSDVDRVPEISISFTDGETEGEQ